MAKRILLVDDDKELAEELAEILRDEGFLIDTAYDGPTGLEMTKKTVYSAILLDVKMPGMNGLELLREIRKSNSSSKVFLVSGNPFLEKLAEQENITGLVTGLINKPFDIDGLLRQLNSI
jgi:DNA-binding response OmpR family regulator